MAAPFAAIVMDGRTGEVLYEKNADARLHPASLTKMMTLYIVFQEIEAGRLSLDTKVTVTKYAASQPPSRLGLKPGQKIAVRYLIRAAAIKSANDAAAALGDYIGGDHVTFAKRMTKTARQLGMSNTTFKNANGLTAEGHLDRTRHEHARPPPVLRFPSTTTSSRAGRRMRGSHRWPTPTPASLTATRARTGSRPATPPPPGST
jgi:D-alanyl-D-alanine carboxypeptidase